MADRDDETEEPSSAVQNDDNNGPQPKGRRLSFWKVRRDLSDEELSSPGVQKMLLDDLDRLEGIEIKHSDAMRKYYETKECLSVTHEKIKTRHAFDVISTGTVAIGSLIFGVAFSVKENDILLIALIALGVILIAIGITAKVIKL